MPYQRRFGQYNSNDDYDDQKKKRQKRPAEEVKSYTEVVTETGSTSGGYMPSRPSAEEVDRYGKSLKQDPTKPMSAQGKIPFLDEPELYTKTSSGRRINPNYDTSIGQDILAGGRFAMQGATGNPFHDLGLALGGLGGGALNKNIAGKLRHQKDVRDVREQNKQIELRTRAEIQLAAEERRMVAEQRMLDNQIFNQKYKEDQAKNRDLKTQNDYDFKILREDSREEYRQRAAAELSKRMGRDISPEAGKRWRQVQVGDYLTLQDQFGNIQTVNDRETGQPISKLTTSSYLDILKKVRELSDYEDDAMKNALAQAEKLVKEEKLSFKTTTSQSIATLNLAKTILKEQGKKTGKVTIGDETIEIEIPTLNSPEGKPLAPEQKPVSNSQFMPPLGDEKQPVHDATGQNPPTAAELIPKYQDFNQIPKYQDFNQIPQNQELDPASLPLDQEPFQKMLETAKSQAPKGATKFKFRLEGATYEYNFTTKKVKRIS